MKADSMSLKAQIRNLAREMNTSAQILLQNYMFERFLERLSLSDYKDKFVLKGGVLVAAIVGVDMRSTMDLDTMFRGLPFTAENIVKIISSICSYTTTDGVVMSVGAILPIRADDVYGGYRVKITATYDTIKTPFNIDISTGDVITPQATKYTLRGIFEEDKQIEIWAYNIETILAEKIETILRRNTLNTRPRDFYDIFILSTMSNYDRGLLRKAVLATAKHRGTTGQITDVKVLLKAITSSLDLRQQWNKYRREYHYASNITYEQISEKIIEVCQTLF